MDKEKFEKMVEMMKGCCKDEESMANCCSMMKKMMQCGEGQEAGKKEKDTGETE
jgi:flagellar biosynthesis regulator FlbT